MPCLPVTPLSRLEDAIAAHAPSHIATLLSPGHMIETPSGFPGERPLKPEANDIIVPAMRRRAPHAAPNKLQVRHADALLDRGGRMIAAVENMSEAAAVIEGVTTPFPPVDP